MGKYYIYSIIIIFLSFFLASCDSKPKLNIYGDIPTNTIIMDSENLKELINQFQINNLLIVTKDAIAVELSSEYINELNLIYENDKKWNTGSETLPITTNLKDIAFIAVESSYDKYRLALFTQTENQEHITPYQKIKSEYKLVGTSTLNNRSITKYAKKDKKGHILSIKNSSMSDTLLIIHTSGKEKLITRENLLKSIKFHNTHWSLKNTPTDTITIIWDKYPRNSIKDVYTKLKEVNSDNPLMCIFVDGLGVNIIENAKSHNKIGFFEKYNFLSARTVYPPKTKYAYFVVGNPLHLNESDQKMKTIFSNLKLNQVEIIEEEKTYYPSKYPITLNTDKNQNGTKDDEIYHTALNKLSQQDIELLFVHFHSIDDIAHKFGPYSIQTLNQIEYVSNFVFDLTQKWGKDFIIFSDHGLHSVDNYGTHGINLLEDMNTVIANDFK